MKIKLAMQVTGASLIVFIAVVGVQLFSTAKSSLQAQEAAISNWASSNTGGVEAVAHFKAECQSGPAEDAKNRIPVRPITFSDCAEKIGYPSLAAAITNSDEHVKIPAPLRWLLGV